jgi:hypothetical protein
VASVPEPPSLTLAAVALILVGSRGGFMFFPRRQKKATLVICGQFDVSNER